MKIQINDSTYEYYKSILSVLITHVYKLYPEYLQFSSPLERLDGLQQVSPTKAKRALKMAIHDLISQIKDFPPGLRTAIDQELSTSNLPSLKELQGSSEKIMARVLKRQCIKTMEEYYLVIEELSDMESGLDEKGRELLGLAVATFEKANRKNSN